MKKGILILMSLTLILASVTAMAEAPRNGGRGTGAGGGSMRALNEAIAYMNGDGVEQDYAKAAELFASVEASENKSATGVVAAGYELGVLYEQGLGVEQDLNKAKELYQEAAEYEYPDAIEALERLSK